MNVLIVVVVVVAVHTLLRCSQKHAGCISCSSYLRQGGNVFAGFCLFVCLFVCLWVSKITQKVMDGSFWNFEGMSGMAYSTSDSVLGMIWQGSWILDWNFRYHCVKGA